MTLDHGLIQYKRTGRDKRPPGESIVIVSVVSSTCKLVDALHYYEYCALLFVSSSTYCHCALKIRSRFTATVLLELNFISSPAVDPPRSAET